MRDFFIHNALYWLEEYQFDGLRLDAVHAIFDDSRPDIVDEIAKWCGSASPDREIHLVLENDRNEAHRLARSKGRIEHCTAQWNDDLHHALHVLITGEKSGFYRRLRRHAGSPSRPCVGRGVRLSGRAVAVSRRKAARRAIGRIAGDCFCGVSAEPRPGRKPPVRNAARCVARSSRRCRPASPSCCCRRRSRCCSWVRNGRVGRPFAFFCDFDPDLAAAVREGRRREFAHFPDFQDENARERIPDPTA